MGDLMALEIPDDPLEAAAFLEQQLALANDKVWSLEDENRELSNKYEMARDNVRVLQRGYKEKIDDLQRKIEDRDARLQEIRQEVQRECEDALRAKDVEIAELTVRINKLKAEKRMSGEQPLTMQQLEECAGDPHAAARARGLSASPAWGLFPGPAMSPIVSWAHADKPPVYHKKEPATEELASERGHSGSQRMSMNGSAHVKLASSSGTAATSASLASMRDTVKGSPASQAYNASRTQEQTREASPEAEEFTVHRAIMSPATSAVPSIAESPEQLERINFPSPSPEPADEQEQAETADLDAAYRIVKERLRASEAGYQAVVRELAEAIDARSDLEVRLTAKQAQVEQLEAQLSTFSPLVHALSREVALALDGAADVASALGAPVHDGQTHVHQELKKTRAEVEQLQKLLAEERCTGSERVASARDALDCVKKRWREEEQTWRTESDELRVRVGELQQRLATRQQV
jgi:chromosome segregation ATPase